MIGYYVHHHGRGHLSRARAIIAHLDSPVTVLSSLPRPTDWGGPWRVLPLDTDIGDESAADVRAGGHLHWVPLGSRGLRERAAAMSAWMFETEPAAVVVDVSVEVALLVRLHGVPVISVALPGRRDDPVHTLGFGVSSAVIAAWPAAASGMLIAEVPVRAVGAISTFAPDAADPPRRDGEERRVLVLSGSGGDEFTAAAVAAARAQTPGWQWEHLGGAAGRWSDDPWHDIRSADVVITHAGQNAVAEVAAARRPAIIVPQQRPFDEQVTTAGVLAEGPWPVIVHETLPRDGWPELLETAAAQDGTGWASWNDGLGAQRAAAIIDAVAAGATA